ncbi:hypothetical protein [Bordetella genomosp. 7]|uniref:Uncharacterized protein n=1 Tax=Bordetella genomosp. 7 TaxID=1416805 RepID=A0A261QYR8_9BORD|nr:hypothetical protein [Bordetella genomosp. 7]OZI17919.1 hypothetical protein CAL19_12615 [Bordetella genomosp. 7]
MNAGYYDLHIDQGATFRLLFTWKDSEGEPVDLSGCEARMQMRYIHPDDLVLSLSTGDGDIVLGGTAGTVELKLEPERTAPLTQLTGAYDLEIVYQGGDIVRLLQGRWFISREVTR